MIKEQHIIDESDLAAMNCDSVRTIEELPGDADSYILEPKYDGFRLICVVMEDGVAMYTRAMKRQDGKLPHVEEDLMKMFPVGTVLDGEIVYLQDNGYGEMTNDFEKVQSVMLSKPERAQELFRNGTRLQYMIFDMPFVAGIDVRQDRLEDRQHRLFLHFLSEDIADFRAHGNAKYERSKFYFSTESCPWTLCSMGVPATQENHDELCAMGMEGSVAKDRQSAYATGGRGKGWYKLKKVFEVDAMIVGFIEGSEGSAYDGLVGGIQFAQPQKDHERALEIMKKTPEACMPTKEIADMTNGKPDGYLWIIRGSCSGLTLDVRNQISSNKDEYLGRIITLSHMGTMKGGVKFRHPQFKRFRPDKPTSELQWHDE